jgi:hypothetical protein
VKQKRRLGNTFSGIPHCRLSGLADFGYLYLPLLDCEGFGIDDLVRAVRVSLDQRYTVFNSDFNCTSGIIQATHEPTVAVANLAHTSILLSNKIKTETS